MSFPLSPVSGQYARSEGERYYFDSVSWKKVKVNKKLAVTPKVGYPNIGQIDLDKTNYFSLDMSQFPSGVSLEVINILPDPYLDEFYIEVNSTGAANITYFGSLTWGEGAPPSAIKNGAVLGFFTSNGGESFIGRVINKGSDPV